MNNRYYDSIDTLPIGIFDKVSKTGDVSLLVIQGKVKDDILEGAWESIFNEFIDEFGLSEDFQEYMRLRGEAAQHYAKAYVDGDRSYRTLARVKEFEAEEVLKAMPNIDFNKNVAYVSKGMGFRVNPNEVSVREFYGYMNALK